MSETSRAPVLVIGIGNAFRGDDGVGLSVARALARCQMDEVDVRESGGDAGELFDLWQDRRAVFIVDAVHAADREAGAVVELDPLATSLADHELACSTHAMGLGQAVELARALGKLPEHLTIFGIVGQNYAPGEGLSPAVAAASGHLVRDLRDQLQQRLERSCTSSP